ncbi:MAG: exonuclease subunit SbcD [Leptospiraceae bacterium]|nr:exonuclease subunit SbcD [Leptospiraceae bacterium]
MKILHTGDWHLGKYLHQFSRLEEQESFLKNLVNICEKENINLIIITGDIFDTFNPPVSAVELFFKYLKILSNNGKRGIVVIAGNHDSPDRIEAPFPLSMEIGVILAGYPGKKIEPFSLESGLKITRSSPWFLELMLPGENIPVRVILTPYTNEERLKVSLRDSSLELKDYLASKWKEVAVEFCNPEGINILVAHLFFMNRGGVSPEESDDEKTILSIGGAERIYTDCIPPEFDYVALGHMHKFQILTENPCPIVYSGSPIAYSTSDNQKEKVIVLIDFSKDKKTTITKIPINDGREIHRKKFNSIPNCIEWLKENPEVFVEITLKSDTYLKTEESKLIYSSHDRILGIIPEVSGEVEKNTGYDIDLSKSMEELFEEYFEFKKKQKPNEVIIDLFKEVISGEF